MIDQHTPTISYDVKRGEPRTRKKNGGDCINCELCVRVCPTGIDIRNGLQMECIQCGRCADACDEIQTNLKRPKGLIRTASESALAGIKAPKIRLRPLAYMCGIIITLSVISYRLSQRADLKYTIVRQPSTTYGDMGENHWGNYFTLRVNNQTSKLAKITIHNEDGLSMICNICGDNVPQFAEKQGLLVIKIPKSYPKDFVSLRLPNGELRKLPLILPR